MTPASLITLRQHFARIAEYHAENYRRALEACNPELARESIHGYVEAVVYVRKCTALAARAFAHSQVTKRKLAGAA